MEAGSGSFSTEKTNLAFCELQRGEMCSHRKHSQTVDGIGMESYFYAGKGAMEVLCTKNHTNGLGGRASSALSGLNTQARLLLQILFAFT